MLSRLRRLAKLTLQYKCVCHDQCHENTLSINALSFSRPQNAYNRTFNRLFELGEIGGGIYSEWFWPEIRLLPVRSALNNAVIFLR